MADFSVSLHEDDSFNLDHDNRVHISKNVDPERSSQNIAYEGNISLQKFYEQTFQKPYEEHIERTAKKHPERVKDMPAKYFDFVTQKQAEEDAKLQKAKREGAHQKDLYSKGAFTKVAKQIIIQVGNTDDLEAMGPEEQRKTRAAMIGALKEYMDTFQAENPALRIVNAVIHVDEISLAPHLHLTYVPVVEQKRGQRVANSLRGALKSMGFHDDPEKVEGVKFQTCQMKWQTKERERVIEIADKFGLSVGYQRGNTGKGQTITEYRAAKQAEREATREQLQIDAQNEALDRREAQVAEQQEQLDHRETVVQKKEQRIDERVEQVNAFMQSKKQELDEAHKNLADREAEVEEREAILQAEAEASVTSLKNEISAVTASLRPSPGKRVEEYPAAPLKKGHRIVPDKDLDALVERSWFSLSHIKKSVEEIIDKFNELPFVQAARDKIAQLEQKIKTLKSQLQERDETIKEQDVLLNKARTLKIDTFGKSMYDRLVEEVKNDRQKVSDMYDHEDDRSGR